MTGGRRLALPAAAILKERHDPRQRVVVLQRDDPQTARRRDPESISVPVANEWPQGHPHAPRVYDVRQEAALPLEDDRQVEHEFMSAVNRNVCGAGKRHLGKQVEWIRLREKLGGVGAKTPVERRQLGAVQGW